MANLYDQVIAGLPSPNMSDMFGYQGSPSGNQIGSLTANQITGIPLLAPQIAAQSTNANVRKTALGTQQQQRQNAANNVNAVNATLYPTSQGAKAFQDYVKTAYPDGKIPARIKELMSAAERGGINDMGLATAMSADSQKRKGDGTYDYGDRLGGLGGGPTMDSIRGDSYLESVLNAPVELARAQNAAALGPTGAGWFAPLLSLVNPMAGALYTTASGAMEQNPYKAIGGIGAVAGLGGAFDGITDSIKGAFDGGGFVNPNALDWTGAGTGANALGLTSPGQWSGVADSLGGFVNPSALATPAMINDAINYTPVSLGGTQSSGGSIKNVLDAARGLIPVEEPQPQQGLLAPQQRQQGGVPYSPMMPPGPPQPMRYFRLETRAR